MSKDDSNKNELEALFAKDQIVTMDEVERLNTRDYVISPFFRDPIRSDFPDHFKLIHTKEEIHPDKEKRTDLAEKAKGGRTDAAQQIAASMRPDRCQEMVYDITDGLKNSPKKIGILYPDRARDGTKNITCHALADRLVNILQTSFPKIDWVAMPVYQVQQTSRTVRDTVDPKFQNRSRFIFKKPKNPKDLPADYILLDFICAKGDTVAEMSSLVTDSISRLVKNATGKEAKVLGTAVMKTDYKSLLPSAEVKERFNRDFTKDEQREIDKILHHIGLSVPALTHAQMLALEYDKELSNANNAILHLKKHITGGYLPSDEVGPTVPEPTLNEVEWVKKNGITFKDIKAEKAGERSAGFDFEI